MYKILLILLSTILTVYSQIEDSNGVYDTIEIAIGGDTLYDILDDDVTHLKTMCVTLSDIYDTLYQAYNEIIKINEETLDSVENLSDSISKEIRRSDSLTHIIDSLNNTIGQHIDNIEKANKIQTVSAMPSSIINNGIGIGVDALVESETNVGLDLNYILILNNKFFCTIKLGAYNTSPISPLMGLSVGAILK